MGGREGIRGYLVQTLIAVLEALEDATWRSIAIEPNEDAEKIDLKLDTPTGIRVAQIKSSENQIGKAQAEQWARDLEANVSADEYALILVGPCSQSVIDLGVVGNVRIPRPQSLNLMAMIERAAHRLDRFLEGRNVSHVPSFARELLINALVTRLEVYSTSGHMLDRNDFIRTLEDWILTAYPSSVAKSVEMQCDILLDTLAYVHPPNPQGSPSILLPIVFVNNGVRTAVIEWLALRILSDGEPRLYTPTVIVNLVSFLQDKRFLHVSNILCQFSELAVAPKDEKSICVALNAEPNRSDYSIRPWVAGEYRHELWVKYRDRDLPVLQRTLNKKFDERSISQYHAGGGIFDSLREIKIP